jgi:MFS transporter, FHS family, L-fucose permease
LVMAIVGGAIITPLMGALVAAVGYQKAFLLPMVCYIFIFYYAVKGHEIKTKASA